MFEAGRHKDSKVSVELRPIKAEHPYPGIGQGPILQLEGGPSFVEKALDRHVLQHSSQVLARQPGKRSPRLQEDGAQAEPHSSGPGVDSKDTGPYLSEGKGVISRQHKRDKAPP